MLTNGRAKTLGWSIEYRTQGLSYHEQILEPKLHILADEQSAVLELNRKLDN